MENVARFLFIDTISVLSNDDWYTLKSNCNKRIMLNLLKKFFFRIERLQMCLQRCVTMLKNSYFPKKFRYVRKSIVMLGLCRGLRRLHKS